MKKFLLTALVLFCLYPVWAQIRVSSNQRFLETFDGKPFFWLGDTDWELFHRLTRDEADQFLDIRRHQGFNVVQAVALAEFNGLHAPNRYGDLPLINDDPTRLAITPGNNPNDSAQYDYWDHVDYIIQRAAEKGLYVGLLPTWGDKVAHLWGDGPIIFNISNAETYAGLLAARYGKYWNVIWVLGGDRPAVYTGKQDGVEKKIDDRPIWRAMAAGIEKALGAKAFIAYHPWGGDNSTSQYIHNEPWLDMNAFQSGHGSREAEAWKLVARDLAISPAKPVLDMEPCYEDHPVNPWDGKWNRQRGYFTAYDVRARIYRGVFAGACGVTYGHHHVWQFMDTTRHEPINPGDTIIYWKNALYAEAAREMDHLKKLVLSRPYFSRIADQSLLQDPGSNYQDLAYATRDSIGSYAMIYIPKGRSLKFNADKISGHSKDTWWFNPRTGQASKGIPVTSGFVAVSAPSKDEDWVFVVDDVSKAYMPPGSRPYDEMPTRGKK